MAAELTIILIGLRGSGKSTLGRALALENARAFVDLDELTPRILSRASVAEAWEKDGEEAFRKGETLALAKALATPGAVLALGGGTPTAPGAKEMLVEQQRAARAIVVYLRASAPTLRQRLSGADNASRPSLTGSGVLDEVEGILARRDPLYLALADEVVEVDGLSQSEALVMLRTAIGQ
ncbi:MAG: shikimate kinase [Phycisphaeraceae bacterium]|nr:shikimate kinase [Phycisphaeraceae bacterium]MBX3366721.1 shikimate kinase [Phycisphaeraceae bacterium]